MMSNQMLVWERGQNAKMEVIHIPKIVQSVYVPQALEVLNVLIMQVINCKINLLYHKRDRDHERHIFLIKILKTSNVVTQKI